MKRKAVAYILHGGFVIALATAVHCWWGYRAMIDFMVVSVWVEMMCRTCPWAARKARSLEELAERIRKA